MVCRRCISMISIVNLLKYCSLLLTNVMFNLFLQYFSTKTHPHRHQYVVIFIFCIWYILSKVGFSLITKEHQQNQQWNSENSYLITILMEQSYKYLDSIHCLAFERSALSFTPLFSLILCCPMIPFPFYSLHNCQVPGPSLKLCGPALEWLPSVSSLLLPLVISSPALEWLPCLCFSFLQET